MKTPSSACAFRPHAQLQASTLCRPRSPFYKYTGLGDDGGVPLARAALDAFLLAP